MATDNNTTAFPMGQSELASLAQRLRARADSVFFRDQPVQQIDLHSAAAAIDELIRIRRELRRLADELADDQEAIESILRQLIGGSS
jgi:hypothetical protein